MLNAFHRAMPVRVFVQPRCRTFARCGLIAIVGCVAFVAAPTRSSAETYIARHVQRDAELCALGTGVVDIDVLVCTRAINSGEYQALSLATLHSRRARAERSRGRLNRALGDHEAALLANPASATGHYERALTRVAQGALGLAKRDLQDALVLFPHYPDAWRARGRVAFLSGDDASAITFLGRAIELAPVNAEAYAFRAFARYRRSEFQGAVSDFEKAVALHLDFPYTPVWIYLSQSRSSGVDIARLDAARDALSDREWPGVLLDLYRGVTDEAQVMDVVSHSHPAIAPRRRYETLFYLAMRSRTVGDVAAVERLLNEVIGLAPELSLEGLMARHELSTLRR